MSLLDPLVAESVEVITQERHGTVPPRPALVRWARATVTCLVRSVEHDVFDEHNGFAMALVSRDVACGAVATWVHLIAVRTWKSLLSLARGYERNALLERADRFFSTSQRIQEVVVRSGQGARVGGEKPTMRGDVLLLSDVDSEMGGDHIVIVYPRTAVRPGSTPATSTRPAPRRVHRTRREVVEILPMTSESGDAGSEALNRARHAFRTAHPDVVAGMAVADGKEGLPEAFASAREVLHTVRVLSYRPGLYQLSDVVLETLVCRSPDLAGHLAARVYPVVDAGEYLVETVEAFLVHGTERKRLARRLYIHPNTLNYRLKRVHELTGLSLTTPRDLSILRGGMISLRLLGHIGEPVDSQPIRTGGIP